MRRPPCWSRRPPPASPAGCRLDPAAADAAQARYTMACDDRVWTVTVQATSSRSTGAQLNEARQAILGAFDADEAQTAPVAGAPGWQSVVVAKPFLLAGVSTWIDGQPATGGLARQDPAGAQQPVRQQPRTDGHGARAPPRPADDRRPGQRRPERHRPLRRRSVGGAWPRRFSEAALGEGASRRHRWRLSSKGRTKSSRLPPGNRVAAHPGGSGGLHSVG